MNTFPTLVLVPLQVKQLCGSPSMVVAAHIKENTYPVSVSAAATHQGLDNVTPMDTEMIQFLVTIENSQEFYSNIVNR